MPTTCGPMPRSTTCFRQWISAPGRSRRSPARRPSWQERRSGRQTERHALAVEQASEAGIADDAGEPAGEADPQRVLARPQHGLGGERHHAIGSAEVLRDACRSEGEAGREHQVGAAGDRRQIANLRRQFLLDEPAQRLGRGLGDHRIALEARTERPDRTATGLDPGHVLRGNGEQDLVPRSSKAECQCEHGWTSPRLPHATSVLGRGRRPEAFTEF